MSKFVCLRLHLVLYKIKFDYISEGGGKYLITKVLQAKWTSIML